MANDQTDIAKLKAELDAYRAKEQAERAAAAVKEKAAREKAIAAGKYADYSTVRHPDDAYRLTKLRLVSPDQRAKWVAAGLIKETDDPDYTPPPPPEAEEDAGV